MSKEIKKMRLSINEPSQIKWFIPLGKLVINFGTLDFLVTKLIYIVSKSNTYNTNDFEQKINYLSSHIEDIKLSRTEKRDFMKALKASKKVYGFRNSIFHSPLIGYKHPDLKEDKLIVVDIKKKITIKLEEVNQALDKITAIGRLIQSIIDKIETTI